MASDPKLVVALEARLNKFEKQLKEAGIIAEKTVKEIEGKFEKANPAFKGTFAGSFLGGVSAGLMDEFTKFISSIPKFFKDISDTAKIAAIDVEKVFTLGQALQNIEATNSSLQKMASLLDRAKRGEDNTLKQLFSRNNIDIKGIKDAEEVMIRLSDLVQRAPNKVRAVEITEAAGASKELAEELGKGPEHMKRLRDEAQKTAPDIRRLADEASKFDKAMKDFAQWAKADAFTGFRDGLQTTAREIGWVIQGLLTMATLMGKLPSVAAFAGQATDDAAAKTETVANQIAPLLLKLQNLKQLVGGMEPEIGGEGGWFPPSSTKLTVNKNDPSKSLDVAAKAEKDRLDAVQRFMIAQDKANAVLQAEIDTLFKSNAEKQIAIALAEAQAAAAKRQQELGTKEIEQIKSKAAAHAELNAQLAARKPFADFVKETENLGKVAADASIRGLRGIEDALVGIASGSVTAQEAFKKLADSLIQELIRIGIRLLITNTLAKALNASLSGFGGGGGFASPWGGAGAPQGVGLGGYGGSFAQGGTLGAGKWGIAGENGPELIKGPAQIIANPVAQTSSATKTGVGTGGEMNVVVNSYNADVQTERRDDRALEITVRGLVRDEMSSGRTNQLMRQKYGMSPRGIARP